MYVCMHAQSLQSSLTLSSLSTDNHQVVLSIGLLLHAGILRNNIGLPRSSYNRGLKSTSPAISLTSGRLLTSRASSRGSLDKDIYEFKITTLLPYKIRNYKKVIQENNKSNKKYLSFV